MASNSNSKFDGCNMSSGKQNVPKFFQVIINPLNQGLMIPKAYIVKYGDTLKKSMLLKVRSGGLWPVQLVRKKGGEIWLQNGCREFGEYYSIEMSQFLVFKYAGNSVFNVMIYDLTGVEIDYASYHHDNGGENSNCRGEMKRKLCNIGSDTDYVSVEILETPNDDIQNVGDRRRTRVHKIKNNRESSFEETDRRLKSIVGRSMSMTNIEQLPSYQRAKAFKSKNPFFISFMQPSYVRRSPFLNCPLQFFERYITAKCHEKFNVVVRDPLGRTREVTCTFRDYSVQWNCPGWKELVLENSLKFADVCVFELEGAKVFNLRIYRWMGMQELDASKINHPYNITGQGRNGDLSSSKMKRASHKNEDSSLVFLYDISDQKRRKQGTEDSKTKYLNHCNCRVKRAKKRKLREDVNLHNSRQEESREDTGRCSKSTTSKNFAIVDKEEFTSYQRAKSFKSKNPFFISFMQPSYVSPRCVLRIPLSFAKRYISSKHDGMCSVVVYDPLGRSREVTCSIYTNDAKWGAPGWRELVKENNLQVADVCVFELVGDKVFNIRIYRKV